MSDDKPEAAVERHYSARLQTWIDEYERPVGYPFSKVRLERLTRYLTAHGVRRRSVLDVGCGVGIPGLTLVEPGGTVHGFDLSPELVGHGRELAAARGIDAHFGVGSAAGPASYPQRTFDLVMALGVFQHIPDEQAVLRLMTRCLADDGLMVISFRNPLFGFITFNRPSHELFGELFREYAQSPAGPVLDEFLRARLDLTQPPVRKGADGTPDIDDIVYKLHDPLSLGEQILKPVGLKVEKLDFYRHHAVPPMLEKQAPDVFREISLRLDAQENDWRSPFLCSTYIAYCRKA